ncbi:MAG TPA: L,D-transpeptidase family protein [bacterium]|nr:L,D-transpeptidase family protein [bacterium]
MRSGIGILWVIGLAAAPLAAQNGAVQVRLTGMIQQRLEQLNPGGALDTRSGSESLSPDLLTLYGRRGFRPVWVGEQGVRSEADTLVAQIRNAGAHALDPGRYHLTALEAELHEARSRLTSAPLDLAQLTDLELLLSDAYLVLGLHLAAGRFNPHEVDAEWYLHKDEADMVSRLNGAAESGTLLDDLRHLPPQEPEYSRLVEAYGYYRQLAAEGGWPLVAEGRKLEKGMWDERVMQMRARLRATADLALKPALVEGTFDDDLERAVRRFQLRHGLDPDGKIGKSTVAEMNIPVAERIRQLAVNLERWRWLPRNPGHRYIRVNIADFNLQIFAADTVALTMRVVVGRTYRRTPVFSDLMTYMVVNPYWTVPTTILLNDIVPKARRDPDYLKKEGIKVYAGWSEQAPELDPATIDWSKVSKSNLPYRLRQDPGPGNSLGTIKFMFPNQFDVYLHDTPHHELFSRSTRAFSSGCIRIEKPLQLALYLLDDPAWDEARLRKLIASRVETALMVPRPILVMLVYMTAWVDDKGLVQFRQDIYQRDKAIPVLSAAAPAAAQPGTP